MTHHFIFIFLGAVEQPQLGVEQPRFMGSTLEVELPQEDEEAIRLQVTRCAWHSEDFQAYEDDPDRGWEENPEGWDSCTARPDFFYTLCCKHVVINSAGW